MPQLMLTISQAANLLCCSSSTIARHIRNGRLRASRNLGYQNKIEYSELMRFVSEMEELGPERRREQVRSALESLERRRNNPGPTDADIASFSDDSEPVSDEIHNARLKDLLSMYDPNEDDLSE